MSIVPRYYHCVRRCRGGARGYGYYIYTVCTVYACAAVLPYHRLKYFVCLNIFWQFQPESQEHLEGVIYSNPILNPDLLSYSNTHPL